MPATPGLLGQLANFRVRLHPGFIHGTGCLSSTFIDQQIRKFPARPGSTSAGVYRNPFGLEGKYFFPAQAQAEKLSAMFTKVGMGGPYTLTSGAVAQAILDAAEEVNAAGEGTAFFLRNAQLPRRP